MFSSTTGANVEAERAEEEEEEEGGRGAKDTVAIQEKERRKTGSEEDVASFPCSMKEVGQY